MPYSSPNHPRFVYPPFFGWGSTNLFYARPSDALVVVRRHPIPIPTLSSLFLPLQHIHHHRDLTTSVSDIRESSGGVFFPFTLSVAMKTAPMPLRPYSPCHRHPDDHDDPATSRLDTQGAHPIHEHSPCAHRQHLHPYCSHAIESSGMVPKAYHEGPSSSDRILER